MTKYKTATIDHFLDKARQKHNDYYEYSNFTSMRGKVTITCPKHGSFEQYACNHVRGSRCYQCYKDSTKLDIEEFIIRSNKVHNQFYSYTKTNYVSKKKSIIVTCPKHGDYSQLPSNHLKGHGCPKCSRERQFASNIMKRFIAIHGNYYDYSKVVYDGLSSKIIIVCPKHGEFKQLSHSHINGKGCSKCNMSKGERRISSFLDDNNIKYEISKKFDNCVNIKALPFDFYIPKLNLAIEYDGAQHFRPVGIFGGDKAFHRRKMLDKIKTKYCIDNGVLLLRIPYTQFDQVEHILSTYIEEIT